MRYGTRYSTKSICKMRRGQHGGDRIEMFQKVVYVLTDCLNICSTSHARHRICLPTDAPRWSALHAYGAQNQL